MWTWEYSPGPELVVGGLAPERRSVVERIAQNIADAVDVQRIGKTYDVTERASGLRYYTDDYFIIVYQEDYREETILILQVTDIRSGD